MRKQFIDSRLPQFKEGDMIIINNNRNVEFVRWENSHGKIVMWIKNEQHNLVGYGNGALKTIFDKPFDPSLVEKDIWRDKILGCLLFSTTASHGEILSSVADYMNECIQKQLVYKVFSVTHEKYPYHGIVFVANESTQEEVNQYFHEKVEETIL